MTTKAMATRQRANGSFALTHFDNSQRSGLHRKLQIHDQRHLGWNISQQGMILLIDGQSTRDNLAAHHTRQNLPEIPHARTSFEHKRNIYEQQSAAVPLGGQCQSSIYSSMKTERQKSRIAVLLQPGGVWSDAVTTSCTGYEDQQRTYVKSEIFNNKDSGLALTHSMDKSPRTRLFVNICGLNQLNQTWSCNK